MSLGSSSTQPMLTVIASGWSWVVARTQPVVPPSRFVETIPPSLDDLVIAMMAKHPDDRPASYAALDAELRAIR